MKNTDIDYLLTSSVQLLSYNGKPLTGGHINVYYAGTDRKYIAYSDWDGTRHPFDIVIPNDGRLVVLADKNKSYDYYVYDSYGNPVFSRKNISLISGGSGGQTYYPGANITIDEDNYISSRDWTVDIESSVALEKSEREEAISTAKAEVEAKIPDVSDMATTFYVDQQITWQVKDAYDDLTEVIHDERAITFNPGENIALRIMDIVKDHPYPYSCKFVSPGTEISSTLDQRPEDDPTYGALGGFLITVTVLGGGKDGTQIVTPDYRRYCVLEMTHVGRNANDNKRMKYICRLANNTKTRPTESSTLMQLNWQKIIY